MEGGKKVKQQQKVVNTLPCESTDHLINILLLEINTFLSQALRKQLRIPGVDITARDKIPKQ